MIVLRMSTSRACRARFSSESFLGPTIFIVSGMVPPRDSVNGLVYATTSVVLKHRNALRTIAAILNRDCVAPPRGQRWNASTINGSGKRGHGLLRNPLYAGRQIWNRVRMVKNPATGKRLSRVNPSSDWHTVDMPHLRIVDQSLFDRVAARLDDVGGPNASQAARSERLLSGLLKCGCCGGGMTIIGTDRSGPRIQCSVHRESGSCSNSARNLHQEARMSCS